MPNSMTIMLQQVCLILVTVLAVSTCPACRADDQPANHIANFAQVGANLYRGAEPGREGLHALKRLGIHTIVDLRMRHDAAEEAEANRLGMLWIHMPMGYFAPSDKQVQALMSVLTTSSYGSIFLHCAQGADRTGTVVALYRILVQDWPLDQVFDEMRAHHFKPWWFALKERVETERQRLDKLKASQQSTLSLRVDSRRMLLDRAANRSDELSQFESSNNAD